MLTDKMKNGIKKIRADTASLTSGVSNEEMSSIIVNSELNMINADADDRQIMMSVVDYMKTLPGTSNKLSTAGTGNQAARKSVIKQASDLLQRRKIPEDRVQNITELLQKFLWGYYILEPLLEDKEISDVRILRYDNISVCRNGKYEPSKVVFTSEKEYSAFFRSFAVMNEISLADINALQFTTDKKSHSDWIFRIAVATGYVNTSGTYFMHIRKHPKTKRNLDDLIEKEMMPPELADYFRKHKREGLLVGGYTGSGKTHFINAMIDEIDPLVPGICIQESEELFSNNPQSQILFLHVVVKNGESKMQYTLEDLSKFGLLTSNRYFINGEIKGDEAAYFANACYTGSTCWTSVHSENCAETMDKLCEYIMRATGYEKNFAMKMLVSLRTVVYMSEYKVMEVLEVERFDEKSGRMIYRQIYRREDK